MNKKQSIFLAVLTFVVFIAAAGYLAANFDTFWSREDAVSKPLERFNDIRKQARDGDLGASEKRLR